MLTQLFELTDTIEFEEDGWLTITSANWEGSNLILSIQVRVPGTFEKQFHIVCHQSRSHRIIALANDSLVLLSSDHVVLYPHNQKQGDLYFNGRPSDPLSLLGALVESHRAAVGTWFSVDHFLYLPGQPADILRGGYGLLAKGPVQLLATYANVLDSYGIKHSLVDSHDPIRWNGEQRTTETEELHALVIGDSFVVAPSFTENVI
ncbi:MAG: hypothetical protein ABL888_18225 [Pirellulaceae bacterium]